MSLLNAGMLVLHAKVSHRICDLPKSQVSSDRPQYLNSSTLNTNGLAGEQARTWGTSPIF